MKTGDTSKTIRLGLFVTAGIVLFVLAIYLIGRDRGLFQDVFRVSAVFRNVNGLQVGNNVRFSGINVGSVENIMIITDSTVRVDMVINEETRRFIKRDATALIGTEGLMGNKVVNIAPGTGAGDPVRDNSMIGTAETVSMDDVLEQLQSTTSNAASITGDLAEIMYAIRSGQGTVGKLVMDSAFALEFEQTIENIKKGTKGFQENMDAAKKSFLLKKFYKDNEEKKKKDKKK